MIILYCNAVTRQRLGRTLLTFIEYHQDYLGNLGIEDSAYHILDALKAGKKRIRDDEDTLGFGSYLRGKSKDPLIRILGAMLEDPISEKCWLMSQEKFDKWARKSSVLAVRK